MNQSKPKQVPLNEVFSPRGVAVVGASVSARMSFAELVLMSLKEAEFPAIYPVNPNHKEILGLTCYANVKDIPGPVDYVVVSVPAGSILSLMDDCVVKGVKAIQFFTAGFSESGEQEGADLEAQMLEKAESSGMRIIGPNCIGMFVPKSRVANDIGVPLEPGPVAFVSQSGGFAYNMPCNSASRGLKFSKVVSYGNALDIDECELLEYLGDDPDTEIVAAYIEGVKNGAEFAKILKKTAAKKPVVVYKGGKTEAGQRAAFGHTASMINSIDVFQALCTQLNTIQVENLDEMIDVLVALRFTHPLPKGIKIALVGAGGGTSVLAGDEIENSGLKMPEFTQGTKEELKQVLPFAGSIFTNPLDTPNMTSPQAISDALAVLGKADEIEMVAYHFGYHPISKWGYGRFASKDYLQEIVDVMKDAVQKSKKPILMAVNPAINMQGMDEFLTVQQTFVDAGLPVYYSLRQLALATARVIAWNKNQTVV